MLKQSPIRKELQKITQQEVSQHNRLLDDLKTRIPHSIKKIAIVENDYLQVADFMCFEYAFGLIYSEEYKEVLELQKQKPWKITPIGADNNFYFYLETNKYIHKINDSEIQDGDIIFYFKNGQPTHAGIMINNRVRSKWGKGLLLDHEIYEVPEKYGDEIIFLKSISLEDVIELFISYAEENGIPFESAD